MNLRNVTETLNMIPAEQVKQLSDEELKQLRAVLGSFGALAEWELMTRTKKQRSKNEG